MNITNIKYFSTVNGTGVRTAVFVAGCNLHCDGCFNNGAWSFEVGKGLSLELIDKILDSIEPEYILYSSYSEQIIYLFITNHRFYHPK